MKIFCIGANKTGTSSLTCAMNKLGFLNLPEIVGYTTELRTPELRNNINEVLEYIKKNDEFDFFEDIPFCFFDNYKLIEKEFPESKFILTIRDSEDWFCSVIRWVNKMNCSDYYEFIYECLPNIDNKKIIIEKHEKRNREIIEYFQNQKKNNLLIMNIPAGDNWNKLCPFLDKEVLKDKFPHENINK